MAFAINIWVNNSENNAVDKDLTFIAGLQCELKDGTDMINPTFLIDISHADIRGANYITSDTLNRKYFITDMRIVRNRLYEIDCHVDVISSYASQIRANKGIVRRSESADTFNLYLNDGSLVAYQDPYILTEPFPNGFTGTAFILAVAGASEGPAPQITITQQPVNYTGNIGDTATFTVSAVGAGTLSYQWYYRSYGGTSWQISSNPTAQTPSISVEITQGRYGQSYYCEINSSVGYTVMSNVATILAP